MVSKKFKVLEVIEGKEYVFSPHAFKQATRKFLATKKAGNLETVFEEVAGSVCVSVDAVKNWNYAKNGPGDIQTVKRIAAYLNMDYKDLMMVQEVKKMSGNKTETMNMDGTKDVVRAVYQKMADFMDAAVNEVGFEDCGDDYYTYEAMYKEMLNLLHRSMLDIPAELYHRLEEIMVDKLAPYIYGYDFGMTSIWETKEFEEFSVRNGMGFAIDKYMAMEAEADAFYKTMRELLKEYIVS